MAIVANTFQSYQAKGIREQLSDVIYNISPTETPFVTNSGKGSATNTYFEWQLDALAAAVTTNAQIEGDDVSSLDAVTPTTRLGNYTQIARKTVIIAGTEEVVNKAGRNSEIAYQTAKKGNELKRDIETGLLANTGAAAGSTSTARFTGSVLAFIKTNTDKGVGATPGVDPVYTTSPTGVRTDGTTRAFTEAMLKNVIALAWGNGGEPKTVMVNASQKAAISGFSGIATKTYYQSAAKTAAIIGAADVYVSDFGTLTVLPNRFMRSREALVLDWKYLAVNYLRPFATKPLATTGDAEKRLILVEYGLKVNHEASCGGVFDLS